MHSFLFSWRLLIEYGLLYGDGLVAHRGFFSASLRLFPSSKTFGGPLHPAREVTVCVPKIRGSLSLMLDFSFLPSVPPQAPADSFGFFFMRGQGFPTGTRPFLRFILREACGTRPRRSLSFLEFFFFYSQRAEVTTSLPLAVRRFLGWPLGEMSPLLLGLRGPSGGRLSVSFSRPSPLFWPYQTLWPLCFFSPFSPALARQDDPSFPPLLRSTSGFLGRRTPNLRFPRQLRKRFVPVLAFVYTSPHSPPPASPSLPTWPAPFFAAPIFPPRNNGALFFGASVRVSGDILSQISTASRR